MNIVILSYTDNQNNKHTQEERKQNDSLFKFFEYII